MAREPKALGPVDRHVVNLLASAAAAADVSQRALESWTGISQGRIGKILRGETPAPSIGELDAIARALGMRASDVFREAEALVDEDRLAEHDQAVASREALRAMSAAERDALTTRWAHEDSERALSADSYGLAASRHDLSRELPNQDEPA